MSESQRSESQTQPISLADVEPREPMPGFRGRFVHGQAVTLAFWRISRGSELPEHQHPHEQFVRVERGELELTVGGVTRVLAAGDVWWIAPEVPHSGRAVTDCEVLDVFQPVREDFR